MDYCRFKWSAASLVSVTFKSEFGFISVKSIRFRHWDGDTESIVVVKKLCLQFESKKKQAYSRRAAGHCYPSFFASEFSFCVRYLFFSESLTL